MGATQLLGTNRGFELNSFAQFTTAENGSGAWSVESSAPVQGTYAAQIASGNVADEKWTASIITDKVFCAAGAPVTGGADMRHISAVNNSNTFTTRSLTINFRFYDSGDSLIGSSEIYSGTPSLSRWDDGTWTTVSATATAPATTAKVAIQVNYIIDASTTNGWNITERWDNFTITIHRVSGKVFVF